MIGAGLGELDVDEANALSFGSDGARSAVWGRAVSEVRFLGWFRALVGRLNELLGLPDELLGEGRATPPRAGDDDNEPALKGWNETEVRLW